MNAPFVYGWRLRYQDSSTKVIRLNGFTQSYLAFQSDWQDVCWALQPRHTIQQQAMSFLDEILAQPGVGMTSLTKVVTVHLRRGDYVKRAGHHGTMTADYYTAGIAMIRSRVFKADPAAAAEGLVVVVFTEQSEVEWCKSNMKWGKAEGVRLTICAEPKGKRCKGELVDMFALSLGDYLIIANSTFSWWSHFFKKCMQELPGWYTAIAATTALQARQTGAEGASVLALGATVFPYRWFTHNLGNSRPLVFDLLFGDVLVPDPKQLFEPVRT
jgi:hypothetical protein